LAATLSKKLGVETKIIKGEKGEFEVVVDGKLIFSKTELGRFPEHDEILEKIPA
jgi:selT/selW/selH-like putative selenoprotein